MDDFLKYVGAAGFLLSLFNLAYTIGTQRRKLELRIVGYQRIATRHLFLLLLENHSRLPIAISSINLVLDDQRFICQMRPTIIQSSERTRGGEVISRNEVFSDSMPIALGSLASTSCHLVFDNCAPELPAPPTQVNFEVATNRGKVMKTICLLDKVDPLYKIRSQHTA